MIEIRNLKAKVEGKEILKGINLKASKGEVHAIMGPNGSGKSTLASVLAGKDGYEITDGEILFNGKNLADMTIEERSNEGLFLGFQYPIEIPGVSNLNFIKSIINAKRKYQNLEPLNALELMAFIKEKQKVVELDSKYLNRSVNEGFSGGEKKRNEIFQMAILEPKLAILDETDSGLDVDALRIVAGGINKLKNSENAIVLITHYKRLLDYIVPNYVHILYNGQIIKTGDKSLALEVEEKGYDWLK